jgi:hypothetical protein
MSFTSISSFNSIQNYKNNKNNVLVDNRRKTNISLGTIGNISSLTASIANPFNVITSSGNVSSKVFALPNTTTYTTSDIQTKSSICYNSSGGLITYPTSRAITNNSYIISKINLNNSLNSLCNGDIYIRLSSMDMAFTTFETTATSNLNDIMNRWYSIADGAACTMAYVYDSLNNPTILQRAKTTVGNDGLYNKSFTGASVSISGVTTAGYYPSDLPKNIYDFFTNGLKGEFIELEFPNSVILKQFEFTAHSYNRMIRHMQFFGTNLTNASGVPISFSPITSLIMYNGTSLSNLRIAFNLSSNDIKYKYIRFVIHSVINHWVVQLFNVSMLVDF